MKEVNAPTLHSQCQARPALGGHLLNCSWCPCCGEADFSAPLRPKILIRRTGPGVFSPFILQDCCDNLWTSVESGTCSQGTICRPVGIRGVRAAGALRGFLRQKGHETVPLGPGGSGARGAPSRGASGGRCSVGVTASRPSFRSPIGSHLPEGRLLRARRRVSQGRPAPPRPPGGL